MLILSRTPGESLVLTLPDGQRVTLTLVEIDRNKVRLGITADRSVRVYRGELLPLDEERGKGVERAN